MTTRRGLLSKARIAGLTAVTVAGLTVGNAALGPFASVDAAPLPAAPVHFIDTKDLLKTIDVPWAAPGAASTAQARVMPAPQAPPTPPPPPPPSPASVTAEELAHIVPQVSPEQLGKYVAPLNEALAKAAIDTPVRKAAFIAQLVVESDSFRTFEEYASGRAYEGRSDLGNVAPGDGERYKGRGAIQVTGRHNYASVSQYLGIDFVAHPELMATPENAFETAAWYWQSRNLNAAAENDGIEKVSRIVNGGTHGLPQRIDNFVRALNVLH
ncbi:glycoside hydrolase family 19 protein [Rhodococcus sp. ABRD24]|uniref:glycoside hydrolase family 19 protein n=1 Tax=Rhodococcus sp. ABRD24 TaxID=2507582 RepID=UPI001A9562E4|nr:glycoside hydrolase family 19 protein [Rhodococcus sp. ABRD24]